MNAAKRAAIYARLQLLEPEPTTELVWSTPFELLAAVLLSAQATDVGVNKATAKLFPRANTPQGLLDLGEAEVGAALRTLNFHHAKTRHLLATCRILVERHGGEVPRERAALEALPGVGRKTASVLLNTAFGEEQIAVDTHIFRVSNRTRLAPGRDVRAVEDALLKVTPKAYRRHAHHWLILHGRYTCKARRPECERCPIFDLCEWPERHAVAAAALSRRPPARSPGA